MMDGSSSLAKYRGSGSLILSSEDIPLKEDRYKIRFRNRIIIMQLIAWLFLQKAFVWSFCHGQSVDTHEWLIDRRSFNIRKPSVLGQTNKEHNLHYLLITIHVHRCTLSTSVSMGCPRNHLKSQQVDYLYLVPRNCVGVINQIMDKGCDDQDDDGWCSQ